MINLRGAVTHTEGHRLRRSLKYNAHDHRITIEAISLLVRHKFYNTLLVHISWKFRMDSLYAFCAFSTTSSQLFLRSHVNLELPALLPFKHSPHACCHQLCNVKRCLNQPSMAPNMLPMAFSYESSWEPLQHHHKI